MTPTEVDLDAFTRIADPLADDTAAVIIGPWTADARFGWAERMARVGAANRLIAQWSSNGALVDWPAAEVAGDSDMLAAMKTYVTHARALPEWADAAKIDRAEQLFMDYGPLSCALLFCASLPECYYLPDLAEVLHVTGQLESNTDYRVRSTAAMVFPVMMKGGLTTPDGGGIAQVLKVRLIHAMIRNLILRGNPAAASELIAALPVLPTTTDSGNETRGIYGALLRHGWNVGQQGQPCSQLQLAYTLLTFSYVYLNGLRSLHLPLSASDEEAVLHAWNVSAHSLGVQRELMVDTMDDARALFERMQERYEHLRAGAIDARPALGGALMDAMAAAIKLPVVRFFPIPMARLLCGGKTARAVGIRTRSTLIADIFFWITLGVAWLIDSVVRVFFAQFSLTRMLTRVVGYHLMSEFLMDQTRPLRLPGSLNVRLQETIRAWSDDAKAPSWINRIEDSLTTHGTWGGEARP